MRATLATLALLSSVSFAEACNVSASSGSLQAAVDKTPAGGKLCLAGAYQLPATLNISKSIHILGANTPITASAAKAINVRANNVIIDKLTLKGPNKVGNIQNCANGSIAIDVGAVSGVRVRDSQIDTFSCGVRIIGGSDFRIMRNRISNVGYLGIGMNGTRGGTVDANQVSNIGVGYPLGTNAYGIVASPNGSVVPVGTVISNNVVTNAPTWECLDTHSGENISFLNNRCFKPGRVGINVAGTIREVVNVRVEGNKIDGAKTNSQWNSVVITGTGTLTGNEVRGFAGGGCAFHNPKVQPGPNTCVP